MLARMPVRLPECIFVSPILSSDPPLLETKPEEERNHFHSPSTKSQSTLRQSENFFLVQMSVCCASTNSFRDAVSRHVSSLSPPPPFNLANRMLETGIRQVYKYKILRGYVSFGISYKYVRMRYFHTQLPILAQKLKDSQIFKFLLDMLRNLRFHVESIGYLVLSMFNRMLETGMCEE